MPLRRVTRYVLIQLLISISVLVTGLCAVIWLTQSLRFVDWMINRGLPVSTFVTIAFLVMPNVLVVVLPVAMFAAVLFVYQRLQQDSELVVMRSVGMGPWRLVLPALLATLLMTGLGYGLTLWLLPTAYRDFKDLQFQVRSSNSGVLLQEGVFTALDDNLTIFVRERTPDGVLGGIVLHDGRNPRRPATMTADTGTILHGPTGPRIIMSKGNRQELDRDTGRVSFLYFDRYTFDIGLNEQETAGERTRNATERYLPELLNPPDVSDPAVRAAFRVEGHQRLASPLLIPAYVMIALAALLGGSFSRRGQAKRIALAIVAVVVVQSFAVAAGNLATRDGGFIWLIYGNAILPILIAILVLLRPASSARRPSRLFLDPAKS